MAIDDDVEEFRYVAGRIHSWVLSPEMLVCDDCLTHLESQLFCELGVIREADTVAHHVGGTLLPLRCPYRARHAVVGSNLCRPVVIHNLDAPVPGQEIEHVSAILVQESPQEPIPAHDPRGMQSP